MNFTSRDKILAMAFPTMMILLVYCVFFLRPKWNELARAETAVEETRKKAPPQVTLGCDCAGGSRRRRLWRHGRPAAKP